MKTLAEQLKSRKKAAYHKLRDRFLKSLGSGKINNKSHLKRSRIVQKIYQIERQLGIRSTLKFKHWALAAAIGLVTTTASLAEKNTGPGRWVEDKNQLSEFRTEGLLSFGDTAVNFVAGAPFGEGAGSRKGAIQDFDGDGFADLVGFTDTGEHSIWLNDGSGNLVNRTTLPTTTDTFEFNSFAVDTLDADGDYDILVVENNYSSSTSQIRLLDNDGSANFTESTIFSHNYPIADIRTADIDDDGDVDILVFSIDGPDGAGPYSFYLKNEGTGFTQSTLTIFSAYLPLDPDEVPLLADLDGDGDVDMLISPTQRFNANYYQDGNYRHAFVALMNNGTGYFGAQGDYVTTKFTNYLVNGPAFKDLPTLMDVDGDGLVDAVLPIADSITSIGFFKGNGDGSFADPVRLDLGTSSAYINDFWLGDIDADADKDILVEVGDDSGQGSNGKSTIRSFIFETSGFVSERDSLERGLEKFDDFALGDLDGDGDADPVGLSTFDMFSFESNAGDFTIRQEVINPVVGENFEFLDVNGDGQPDLISDYMAQILINDGTGGFTLSQTLADSIGTPAVPLTFGDFDNDGDIDVVLAGKDFGYYNSTLLTNFVNVQAFVNEGGVFTSLPKVGIQSNNEIKNLKLGEVDGDPELELIIIASSDGDRLIVCDFNGTNFDTAAPLFNGSTGLEVSDIVVFDTDGDLDNDLVFGAVSGAYIFNNDGTGTAFTNQAPPLGNYMLSKIDTADVDFDGDVDMLLVTGYFSSIGYHQIAINNGDSTFTISQSGLGITNTSTDGAFADLDNDGDFDIIVNDEYIVDQVFENGDTLNFQRIGPSTNYSKYKSAFFDMADVDGDGDIDMVSVKADGTGRILYNQLNTEGFPPELPGQLFTVNENAANGTSVGTIVGSDPEGETLTYSIVSGNESGAFALDSITGEITVANGLQLDFETTAAFILNVAATTGPQTVTAIDTIQVLDLNELFFADTTFQVDHRASNGAVVGVVNVIEPEGDALGFTIASGDSLGVFAIDNIGQITVQDSSLLDYQTTPNYSLDVQVTDGSLTHSGLVQIQLVVLSPDVEDQLFTVNENVSNGTMVGTIVGLAPQGDTLTYSIVSGNESGAFALSSSGELSVADSSQLDYEVTAQFGLNVEATAGGQTTSAVVTVQLSDQNELTAISDTTFQVGNNAANGTVVGVINAIDPEGGPLTFSIESGDTLGVFAINSSGEISVLDNSTLSYNSTPTYSLQVSVTDGSLVQTGSIGIEVVLSSPEVEDQSFTVNENTANGTLIGTIVGTTPVGSTLTYSITSGNESRAFTLNSSTGALTVADSSQLNYEVNTQFALNVEATTGPQTVSALMTIQVLDVNELIAFPQETFRVDQDAVNGTLVGIVKAVDPEGSPLTYNIEAGDAQSVFAINGNGEITVQDNNNLDYATTPNYTLSISVTDGQLTRTGPITIRVTTLARDQAVLMEFFNAADGLNWTLNSNWSGSGTLDSSWGGVTVSGGRVTGVALPSNGIKGAVPASFADLTGLTNIDLSGNEIDAFPDVSFFPNLTNLNLANNRLGIKDLLANSQGTYTYGYSPQKAYGVAGRDTIQAGSDFTLEFPELNGYTATYSWTLGGAAVGSGENFAIVGADFNKMGTYVLSVSGITGLSGLTLTTQPHQVYVETDVFGKVSIDEGGTPLTAGQVNIYRIFDGPFELTDSAAVDPVTGNYVIDNVVLGDFILLVQNDVDKFPDVLQTYYVSTDDWINADTLSLLEEAQGINILMQTRPTPEIDTLGATLLGLVETNFANDNRGDSRLMARRKVKKAGCSLRRRTTSGGGRTEQEEYKLVAYVESDDQGEFSFEQVPPGDYLINIQYPGVPMDPNSDIYFTIGEDFDKQTFQLNATITEEGISVNIEQILGIKKPYLKDLKLYPNPTEGKIKAEFTVYRKLENLKMEVLDLQGQLLERKVLDPTMGASNLEIDLSTHEAGMYFLVFSDDAENFRYVIKIGKK